jgi:hypothetical protein
MVQLREPMEVDMKFRPVLAICFSISMLQSTYSEAQSPQRGSGKSIEESTEEIGRPKLRVVPYTPQDKSGGFNTQSPSAPCESNPKLPQCKALNDAKSRL